MVYDGGSSDGPRDGEVRPFTSPLEREPTALSVANVRRPATSFPATGFDAELERLESDDVILRQMAMNNLIAMAKHGGSTERMIAMMIGKLQDGDKLFRGLAVEALSRSAKQVREEVTSALIQSLQDPDANVRCRAVEALRPACRGPSHPRVVAALSGMLQDENPFVYDAAVNNLQHAIPQASWDVRKELLSSVHRGIRTAAIDSFKEEILQGSEKSLDLIVNMLKDNEFQVRMAAVSVISDHLTIRDTKVTKEQEAMLKSEGREHDFVAPAKAEGPMIDTTLSALMSALEDNAPDIRTAVLRSLTCNTARLNQNVFKAVLVLLSDEVDGTRQLACEWVSRVVAFTQERERKEWAYNIVIDLVKSSSGRTQLSAAWVVARVVATGNTKYLKDVIPLLMHEHPLTRVAALWALLEAVKNVVSSIMWSSSGAPTVPRALSDPDRRVRLACIAVLSQAPEGTRTASQPLLNALEDDDREVRNAAADALSILLARIDLKQKLTLTRIVAQNSATQDAIGTGCNVGSKYVSLEVGYIGNTRRSEQHVRAAAVRALRKMGVPDEIIRLGVKAMEVALERHSLGYRYELPPNFWEEHNADGTPKKIEN